MGLNTNYLKTKIKNIGTGPDLIKTWSWCSTRQLNQWLNSLTSGQMLTLIAIWVNSTPKIWRLLGMTILSRANLMLSGSNRESVCKQNTDYVHHSLFPSCSILGVLDCLQVRQCYTPILPHGVAAQNHQYQVVWSCNKHGWRSRSRQNWWTLPLIIHPWMFSHSVWPHVSFVHRRSSRLPPAALHQCP